MNKRLKCISLLLAMLLCAFSMQSLAFADGTISAQSDEAAGVMVTAWDTTKIEPRGMYLLEGGCSITPGSKSVKVNGYTEAYQNCSELTVKLTVLQEVSTNVWTSVWTDTFTDYNTDYAWFATKTVKVAGGHDYMVEAVHTVKHNGRTETTESETTEVYVP